MSIQSDSVSGVAVGAVVADTYRVIRLIGKGGMGAVWEADHQRLPGKKVAIKVLNADISQDEEQIARFRREAEIASRLGHPNIVAVTDFNTLPDGAPYLVLELLNGEGLDQRLLRGPMSWEETVKVTRQIGSALAAAHDQGVVHRDLKPQNVFLCPTDVGGDLITVAKVLDFGISKIRGSQTIKTQEQTLLGTPQYMSPEQATGTHSQIDQRTDLFALAAMVYEMLSGKPAFSGNSVPEVLFKVVYEPAAPLADQVTDVPATAVAAVEKALSKKPEERFADVASFIEELTGRALGTFRGSSKIPATVAGTPAPPAANVATAETEYASERGAAIASQPSGAAAGGDDATAATVASGAHDKDALPAPASVASKRGAVDPNLELGLDATVASTGRGSKTPVPALVEAPGGNAPAAGAPAAAASTANTDANHHAPPGDIRRQPWLIGGAVAVVAIAGAIAVLAGGGERDRPRRSNRQAAGPPTAPVGQAGASRGATPEAAGQPTTEQTANVTSDAADVEAAGPGSATGANASDGATAPPAGNGSGDPANAQENATAGDDSDDQTGAANGDRATAKDPQPSGDNQRSRGRAAGEKNRDADKDRRDGDDGDDSGQDDAPPEVADALAQAMAAYRAGDFAAARLAAQRTTFKRPSPMAYAIITMSYCGLRDLGNARANLRKVGRWKRRVQRQCRRHGVDL